MLSILLPIVLGVVGQLLLKHGMVSMGKLDLATVGLVATVQQIVSSPFVIAGIATYGISTFFWLLVLNKFELSYAYPFLSIGYVLIFLFAWILFQEQIQLLRVIGMLVICLGVVLVSRS